jgi:hypothetical protein
MVVAAITVVMVGAAMRAYAAGIVYDERLRTARERNLNQRTFESRLTELLRHAYLSPDAAANDSFFIGNDGPGEVSGGSTNATTLTFTTLGSRPPGAFLESEEDFETNNERFGPQGGIGEISLSMTATGTAGTQTGLFIREQRPADGDVTQGGNESVLSAEVEEIQFEFFDGLEWQPQWDTQTQTTKRLPAAVRVTYRLAENEQSNTLIVRIPASDVTPENPVTVGG